MGAPLLLLGAYAASAKAKGDRRRRERADAALKEQKKEEYNNKIVHHLKNPQTGEVKLNIPQDSVEFMAFMNQGFNSTAAGTRVAMANEVYKPDKKNNFINLYMNKNRNLVDETALTQEQLSSGDYAIVGQINSETGKRTSLPDNLLPQSTWFNSGRDNDTGINYVYPTIDGPMTKVQAEAQGVDYDPTKPVGYVTFKDGVSKLNIFNENDRAAMQNNSSNKMTVVTTYLVGTPGEAFRPEVYEDFASAVNAVQGISGATIYKRDAKTDYVGNPVGPPTITEFKAPEAGEPEKVFRTLVKAEGKYSYVSPDQIPEGAVIVGQVEGTLKSDGSFTPTGEFQSTKDTPKLNIDEVTQPQFKVGETTIFIPKTGDLASQFNSIISQFSRTNLKAAFQDTSNTEVDSALNFLVSLIEQKKNEYLGGGGTDLIQANAGLTFVQFARDHLGDNVLVEIPGLKKKLEERDRGILASERDRVESEAPKGKARNVSADNKGSTITFMEYPEQQQPFVMGKLVPALGDSYPNKTSEEIKFEVNLNYSSPSGEPNAHFNYLASLNGQKYDILNMTKFDYLKAMTDPTKGNQYISNEFGREISGSYSQYTKRNPRVGVSLLRPLIQAGHAQEAMLRGQFSSVIDSPTLRGDFETKHKEQAQSAIAAKATMQGFLDTYIIRDPDNPGQYLRDPNTNEFILRPSTGVLDTRAIVRGAKYTFGALADFILPDNGGVKVREAVNSARGQLNSLYYNVFSTEEEKKQVEAGKAQMNAIMAEIESETDAATAERKLYMVMTAYQIAATIQGGTGGRTISDQDVALIFRALSQNFFSTGPEAEVRAILAAYEFVDMLGYRAEVLSNLSDLRDPAALALHDKISNATGALNFDKATTAQLIDAFIPNAADIRNKGNSDNNLDDNSGEDKLQPLTKNQVNNVLEAASKVNADGSTYTDISEIPQEDYATALGMLGIPYRPQSTIDNSTDGNQ